MKGNLRSWVNIDREGEGVIMLLWYMYFNLSFYLTLNNARDKHFFKKLKETYLKFDIFIIVSWIHESAFAFANLK